MLTNMLRVFACGSIACAVSNWWSIEESFGISEARQNDMADAFEHAAGYRSVL